jgi:2OG-Fe(II) oxygenase superfamily
MNKTDDIKYIKGFMPKDIVDTIFEYAKKYDLEFDEFGNHEKEFTVNVFKRSDEETMHVKNLVTEWGLKVYEFVLDTYGGDFKSYDPNMSHIARFEPGWGMHEHFDASKPNDIATLIYINNNYSGGDIYFPEYGISHKPEPGDLLTFPDNPDYVHGVRAISDGIRYTTPRWFTRIV